LATEAALLAGAVSRRREKTAVVPPEVLNAVYLDYRRFVSREQWEMAGRLLTRGAGVEVVVGAAGTGKTRALASAAAAWVRAGYTVTGTALAARAAAELSDATGIASSTLAKLFRDLEVGAARLDARTVVMVDEAAMVGTRDLARLCELAGRAGAKVVLVGDDRQPPAIDAGGAFGALARGVGAIQLGDNRRQEAAWERRALAELRSGDPQVALDAYRDHGRLVEAGSAEAVREAMVDAWWEARSSGASVAMVATRRDEVERLNTLARDRLRHAGHLGAELFLGGRFLAVGEEVIATRNDRRIGVLNGTRGVVIGLDPASASLSMRTDEGNTVALPGWYVDRHR